MKNPQITVQFDQDFVSIPYPVEKHDSGKTYEYRSLFKNINDIENIPELSEEKIIKEFIRHIHQPDGVFEAFRCLKWFDSQGAIHRKVFVLGFHFRHPDLFSEYSNCIAFLGNLLNEVSMGKVETDNSFRFDIQQARHFEKNREGYVMDLYFSGNGDSLDDASLSLDNLIRSSSISNLFLKGMGI